MSTACSVCTNSSQQYVAVQQHLVPPDTLRLRYRTALNEIVAAMIRNVEPATDAVVRSRCRMVIANALLRWFCASSKLCTQATSCDLVYGR